MATFHAKVQLIIHVDKFGISHVIEKYLCLCVMFNFHLRMMDVSKDDACDANNNVNRSIYHVSIIGDLNLDWRLNAKKF